MRKVSVRREIQLVNEARRNRWEGLVDGHNSLLSSYSSVSEWWKVFVVRASCTESSGAADQSTYRSPWKTLAIVHTESSFIHIYISFSFFFISSDVYCPFFMPFIFFLTYSQDFFSVTVMIKMEAEYISIKNSKYIENKRKRGVI